MATLLYLLGLCSAALTAAVLLVYALGPVLRRMGGAGLAYAAWLLVPLVLMAALLPRPAPALSSSAPVHAVRMPSAAAPTIVHSAAVLVQPDTRLQLSPAPFIALWAVGSAALLAWMVLQHLRYLRGLGPLQATPSQGVYRGANEDAGPALVGIVRTRVVVPSDFESRYSPQEQAMILAHERIHAQRGDPIANALCGALLLVFWFHPLAHLAARSFRNDQELACDAAVLDQFPTARRAYADAVLKTQLASRAQAFACTWRSPHPLKGRIMSIASSAPAQSLRKAGKWTLSAGIAAACLGAWSLAPAAPASAPSAVVSASSSPEARPAVAPAAGTPAPSAAKAPKAVPGRASADAMVATLAPAPPAARPVVHHADRVDVVVHFKIGDQMDQTITMKGVGLGDNLAQFTNGADSDKCDVELRVLPATVDDSYSVQTMIRCHGKPVSTPRLVAKLGYPARISSTSQKDGKTEGFDMNVMVSRAE